MTSAHDCSLTVLWMATMVFICSASGSQPLRCMARKYISSEGYSQWPPPDCWCAGVKSLLGMLDTARAFDSCGSEVAAPTRQPTLPPPAAADITCALKPQDSGLSDALSLLLAPAAVWCGQPIAAAAEFTSAVILLVLLFCVLRVWTRTVTSLIVRKCRESFSVLVVHIGYPSILMCIEDTDTLF